MLSRRQFLIRSGALAGALAVPSTPAFGAANLRKMIDIGPGGVIYPGSAQDYRFSSNRTYFADTQTGWIRMWADWPSLQPDGRYRIDDPASPGYPKLLALDDQIRQACADGLRVMLLPYTEFTTNVLDSFSAIGYTAHSGQGWSHHNYSDVEGRVTTRVQLLRDRLRGRWTGKVEPGAPTVWITEGGARPAKMKTLYPAEDPLAAQAKCLQTAWNLHSPATGGGEGVAMLAQYLLYADPNFDCGLLEPSPSTVKRPAYTTWKTFPKRL